MKSTPVNVTDLDIPFWRLVWLLIKIAIAAIPATIVLAIGWGTVLWFVTAAAVIFGG